MKRYIRSSDVSDYNEVNFYQQNVDMDLDSAVETVLSSNPEDVDYSTLKSAVDAFFADLQKIPSGRTELNIEYDRDKGRIYKKYRTFADKCKEISKTLHPTGYGRNDFIVVKKQELCKSVDWKFPYGWKTYI